MYLPIFYYPVQEDDRATGFLIPVYGTSTVRGQSLSNAFFWAISRSQDATFMYDWYSKTGQGFGGEYRYELGAGNRANADLQRPQRTSADYQQSDGSVRTSEAARSFLMRGGLSQALGAGLHARANVNYTSSLAVQQQYQQNILQTTNRHRNLGGNVTGNWQEYVMSATFERNDTFYDEDNYDDDWRAAADYVQPGRAADRQVEDLLRREQRVRDAAVEDRGPGRDDDRPGADAGRRQPGGADSVHEVAVPERQLDRLLARHLLDREPRPGHGLQIPHGVNRPPFFDFQARITGPVFNRIFDTPNNGYATEVQARHRADAHGAAGHRDRRVQPHRPDRRGRPDRGRRHQLIYGLNNRLYAKKTTSREIVSVGISQTYYSDARASQVRPELPDQLHAGEGEQLLGRPDPDARVAHRPLPDRLLDRVQPDGPHLHDVHDQRQLQQQPAPGDRRLEPSGDSLPGLAGFDNVALANHDINATTTIRNPGNHLGGTYSFNYDLRNDNFRQQRILAFYNAQCCGINIEYQTYNLGGTSQFLVVPQDHRFNLSFTLAGIGTFSNFFGAFGGQQGR